MAKAAKPAKKVPAKKASSKKAPPKKAAKAAVKKKDNEKGAIGIKYSDKSTGQPHLVPIFEEIKKLLSAYSKGNLVVRGGEGGQVAVVNETELMIHGKKRKEFWFAAALVQKGYVGFYFMPIYVCEPRKDSMPTELMKTLKGKSCFHITKHDPQIMAQIKDALKLGYEDYKQRGWV
jgi:hypothetical protein